jgi:hypothetical protein
LISLLSSGSYRASYRRIFRHGKRGIAPGSLNIRSTVRESPFVNLMSRLLMRLGVARLQLTEKEWQMARALRVLDFPDADMTFASLSVDEAIAILNANDIPLTYERHPEMLR